MKGLRILCLHGFRGSADTLRRQLAPLAGSLDDLVEFVYVDAPSLGAGGFGWWRAVAAGTTADQMDAGVGRGMKRYEGWQRTRDAIATVFARQGPFDGVFGFSQGAALAALLVGLRSRGRRLGNGPVGATTGVLSLDAPLDFDFAVMVGGFVSADADLAKLYAERASYDLPSAHIIGRSDSAVPRVASLMLASKFTNPLLLEHEGGHIISTAPEIRQGFRTFLEEMRSRNKLRMVAQPRT
jgi:hypothetical protein